MTTGGSRFAFFDGDDGTATLLSEYRRTIRFDGTGALEAVFEAIEAALAQGEWVALAANYALGSCFEPAARASAWGPPRLSAWVFGRAQQLSRDAVAAFFGEHLAAIPEHDRVAGVAEVKLALDAASYVANVEQIQHWITDGDCYQINLTFPLDCRLFGHPLALYVRLRERQPVRYGAFISTPEQHLLSFSPELFFERIGEHVVTRPMKGTAPRGVTPDEDEARRYVLLASEKERAENVMIVDLLRNDLGRLAAPGEVRVESLCATEAYPSLWQMVSTVSADLPAVQLFDLFRALFPCGSITGAPKIRAMQRIAELERRPRGLYTGALGWLAPGGDCRFNVAIRTLEIEPDRRAKLGIGSGIVIDADPEREYAECLLKAKFLTGYDPGFKLIETMRLEDGTYPLLILHLERLEKSAGALGFACEIQPIRAELSKQALENRTGVFRVRVTLTHDGAFQASIAMLNDEECSWRVVLSDEVLDSDDYLLRHKTSARSRYDGVLSKLPADVFDAIFFNSRGEVCEGARSNVYVERDGKLLTPPLACGLLPGVMRRQLLQTGRAVEQVLTQEDLRGATTIYLSNALRGLIAVSFQG